MQPQNKFREEKNRQVERLSDRMAYRGAMSLSIVTLFIQGILIARPKRLSTTLLLGEPCHS
jgi:hypothetical protein